MRPPGLRQGSALVRISVWIFTRSSMTEGCSLQRTSTRRRITPVFEHGTSRRMASKMPCKRSGAGLHQSWTEVSSGLIPRRSRFCSRRGRRFSFESVQTRPLPPPRAAAMRKALPPGAAQASRTFSPGFGFRSSTQWRVAGSWM